MTDHSGHKVCATRSISKGLPITPALTDVPTFRYPNAAPESNNFECPNTYTGINENVGHFFDGITDKVVAATPSGALSAESTVKETTTISRYVFPTPQIYIPSFAAILNKKMGTEYQYGDRRKRAVATPSIINDGEVVPDEHEGDGSCRGCPWAI